MAADVRFSPPLSRVLLLLLSLVSLTTAFYIPGWSIKSFAEGDLIPLFHNKIFSDSTALAFAYSELPFVCPPKGTKHPAAGITSGTSITLNLGEVLRGDRITISDYYLRMGDDAEPQLLCSQKVDRAGVKWAQQLVADGYAVEWIVDNLPGATSYVATDKSRKYYSAGFALGYEEVDAVTRQSRYFINNHVTLVIRYRQAPGRAGRWGEKVVVGFEVYPRSVAGSNRNVTELNDVYENDAGMELTLRYNATDNGDVETKEAEELDIPFSYAVYFREEENEKLQWANRWDMYFVPDEDAASVHWLAVVNSLVICGVLTSLVAVIFMRTIRGDFKNVSEEEGKKLRRAKSSPSLNRRGSLDKSSSSSSSSGGVLDPMGDDGKNDAESVMMLDDEDVTGWKLIHGDVFRTPTYGPLLAPLVGSGIQLCFMAVGLISLSCLGVLNPSFRGGFVCAGIVLFVVAGVFSGYFSARVYKTFAASTSTSFGGKTSLELWQYNALVTGTVIPGLLFLTVFILNLFVWANASSTAIPFGTLVALLSLWLLVQLPLVYVGALYGHRRGGPYEHPVKPTVMPRHIPPQPWSLQRTQLALLAGLVPFLIVLVELMFVFKSVWLDKGGYYYVFGFAGFVFGVVVVSVVEVSVVAVYLQLCAENYHWWWTSFAVGGASSVWIFAYCVWYYHFNLHITSLTSTLLFFGYSGLACAVWGLLTGTIGFLAAYAFVRRIYSAIKVD